MHSQKSLPGLALYTDIYIPTYIPLLNMQTKKRNLHLAAEYLMKDER